MPKSKTKSKTAKAKGKAAPAKKVALKQASTAAKKTPAPKAKPAPAKAKLAPAKAKLAPAKAKLAPAKAKLAPAKAKPAPAKAKPAPAKAKPAPVKAKAAPQKANITKSKLKKTLSKPKTQPTSGAKAKPIKAATAAKKPVSNKGASMASSKKADSTPKVKSITKAVPTPKSEPTPAPKKVEAPTPTAIKVGGKAEKTASAGKKPTAGPVHADLLVKKKILPPEKKVVTDEWVLQQRERIYELRDNLVESMHGVAKDTLRSRAEGSEASAFGMHQADAGSDSYDRDFALSLLSQEQDALYEIDEALKRIDLGTYGVCEMSGKVIKRERLEALPFARYTVECQAEVERQKKLHKARMPVTSLFGLTDDEASEGEEEDQTLDAKE